MIRVRAGYMPAVRSSSRHKGADQQVALRHAPYLIRRLLGASDCNGGSNLGTT